jgi:tight adherence protein B
MWLLIVFTAIFAAIVLLLFGVTAGRAAVAKRTADRLEAIRSAPVALSGQQGPLDLRISEPLSGLPWLDRWLQGMNLAPRLQLMLRQADLKWTVGRLVLLSLLCGLGVGYLVDLRTHAHLFALGITVLAGAGPLLYVRHVRQRRFDRIRELLPDAIDLMVAAIRAGQSLYSAMGLVARESPEPVRGEFRQCYEEQSFGLDLRSAMTNFIYRLPTHDIRIIAAGVLIQKETGGNLTEILESVSHLIREDARLRRQVGVHTAQGRLTGYILAGLPVILGFLMYMMSPDQVSLLWTRPIGLKMLYGSAISTTIGMLIIRKIVNIRI